MSEEHFSRRTFVSASAAAIAAGAISAPRVSGFARVAERVGVAPERATGIEELTITELQAGLRAGTYTARSLVEQYRERIESLDQKGPALNHIIELNPDALPIADQRDAERRAGRTVGPLHGMPILVKDNIDTADRMHTSAGSLALATSIAPRDSWSPSGCARRARSF